VSHAARTGSQGASLRDHRSAATSADPEALAEQFILVARRLERTSRRTDLGGLSLARYDALHTVFHADGISMSELAGRLGVVARTVTGLVDGLEHDGLLQRVPDAADRRRINLVVTTDGRAVLGSARQSRIAAGAMAFAELEADERAQLSRLLHRVDEAMDVDIS
jgi:DNA-binding MarR family transcriptional regulator